MHGSEPTKWLSKRHDRRATRSKLGVATAVPP
jgi:hypothetical protein